MPGISPIVDGSNPNSIELFSREVARALNTGTSFGDPTHPIDTAQFPNGLMDNMRGSFRVVEFTATNTAVSIAHNLGQATTGTSSANPNVIWFVCGFKHDGNSVAGGTEPISIEYRVGDTITADAIELRVMAAGSRVVDGTHPLTVVLWFQAVTPW